MGLHSQAFLPALSTSVEVNRTTTQGKDFLVLTDSRGIAESSAYLPIDLIPLVQRFDGSSSVQSVLAECYSAGYPASLLEKLYQTLEDGLLIDSSAALERVNFFIEEFKQAEIRMPSHAGHVYPLEANELDRYLTTLCRGVGEQTAWGSVENVTAMAVPHIDYARGANSYGIALHLLEKVTVPDVIFLLGTAHQFSSTLFQLTKKSFSCPFGILKNALDSVTRITSSFGVERSFLDEFLHYKEHSLEFQLPLLFRAGMAETAIIPILVSSLHDSLVERRLAIKKPEVSDFVRAVADEINQLQRLGKRVVFYCGVDLSHLGRYFGDPEPLTQADCLRAETEDRVLLEAVCRGSSEDLFWHVAADLDRRRICGFPSLYVMLAVYETLGIKLEGQVAHYQQAYDESSDCLVSCATVFWRAGA